jgi:glycosyltransferase involved in cell wall biosynthesis
MMNGRVLNSLIVGYVSTKSLILESLLLRIYRSTFWLKGKFFNFAKDSSSPKVSIILPTFNRVSFLFERSIPSVLNQTYSNWELLVVSHGCTDDTDLRVQRLSKTDPRIKLINIKRNRLGYPPTAENHWLVGPVRPINAGLKKVTGDWIARIDDDDEWLPNHLESSIEIGKNPWIEFISSGYEVTNQGNTRVILPEGDPPIGGVQTWVYRSYLAFFRSHLTSWRKSWNRVNDTDVAQRMRKAGVRITHHNNIGASIRPRIEGESIGSKAYLENSNYYRSFYDVQDSSD